MSMHTNSRLSSHKHDLLTLQDMNIDYYQKGTSRIDASINSAGFIDVENLLKQKKGYQLLKRTQDIFFSTIALIVLFPFMAIIAFIIYLDDPKGSPIFSQIRVGKNGKCFRLYKFRTMCVNAEEILKDIIGQNEKDGPVFKIKNDPRITRFGHFIRKTSIDELPQLFNVLIGDMSIVGPRPALQCEVEQYTKYQRQRLMIHPGLTCYWQIQPCRDHVSFEKWMDMDIAYIRNRSLWVDWKIILKTIVAVLRCSGE